MGIPVKVREEGFVTVTIEIHSQKEEEPSVIVETELDKKLEEKLRDEFRKKGPISDNFTKWKGRALKEGTLRKDLGINGGEVLKVKKEVKKIDTEKIIINFPVDVSFYLLFSSQNFEKRRNSNP